MLWLGAILVALVSIIVSLVVRQSPPPATARRQRPIRIWRRSGLLVSRAIGSFTRRAAFGGRRASTGFPRRDGMRRAAPRARWGRHPRVVAVLELILFIVLLSTLFAGALAAVAIRLGHGHLGA